MSWLALRAFTAALPLLLASEVSRSQEPAGGVPPGEGAIIWGEAEVIDGDTLRIAGMRVRLEGIDAPEMIDECLDTATDQTFSCGSPARDLLIATIGGRRTLCRIHGGDRYGRLVGTCKADNGDDPAMLVVASGLARADKTEAHGDYHGGELLAQTMKSGFWDHRWTTPPGWEAR